MDRWICEGQGEQADRIGPHSYDFLLGKAIAYKINPGALHAIFVDVAADGESLRSAAKDTKTAGDSAQDNFGTATTVKSAFDRFWGSRDDIGQRAASLVFRKATAVADTAAALMESDGKMSDAATTAMSHLPTNYTAAPAWATDTGGVPFNFSSGK
ncbi:hypothetical protein [Arthrobacter rhombi]|uniref:hypothetical protein n=1 Tax=Arthrobacter rhombi TaxID=71253 RepID=UPI003F906CCD